MDKTNLNSVIRKEPKQKIITDKLQSYDGDFLSSKCWFQKVSQGEN